MQEFNIKIDTTTEAFGDTDKTAKQELARILMQLALDLMTDGEPTHLSDKDTNTVGLVSYTFAEDIDETDEYTAERNYILSVLDPEKHEPVAYVTNLPREDRQKIIQDVIEELMHSDDYLTPSENDDKELTPEAFGQLLTT